MGVAWLRWWIPWLGCRISRVSWWRICNIRKIWLVEFSWLQGWVSRGRHGISWLWVSWIAWLVATGRGRVGIVWVGYLHHCHLVDRVGQSHAYLQPALCKQLPAEAACKPATAPVTQPTFPEMKGSLGRDCSSMRTPTKVAPLTNTVLPSSGQAGPSNKMMRHPLNQPWVLGVGAGLQTKPTRFPVSWKESLLPATLS